MLPPKDLFKRLSPILAGSLLFSSGIRAEPIISEFLAENTEDGIKDEDGFPADWIEIHNPDATPVNLAGYSLTDDADLPAKWTFPSVNLPAGGYLRVFASGKDRTDDPLRLHTNFSLGVNGEYLALVKPDGSTVADEFAPEYPPQIEGISYGLGNGGPLIQSTIIPVGAPLTYLIPDSDIGNAWQTTGFNDDLWTEATSAIGFGYSGAEGSQIGTNGDVEDVMKRVNASIYLRFPFQVEDPAGIGSLTARVKIDDGFVIYLNGQEVASKNAPSPLLFDSRATKSEEVDPGEDFENFILDIDGKLVAGENILAIQAMNNSPNSSDFIIIPELVGEIQNLTPPFPRGYFPNPTPEAANGAPSLPPPSAVDFDVTSRAFSDNFQVSLSVAEPDAIIRYTIDGTVPSNAPISPSPEYTGPITINKSTLVRAKAFISGSLPGPGRSEGYMKIAADQANFTSDLPIVLLSTFGKGAPPGSSATTRKDTFMLIYEPAPETGRSSFNGTPTIATRGGFRKRGSSSAGFPKYAMSFESWDENDNDKDIEPLGMAPEADWILNTRYTFDYTLMRNPFIYSISNQIGRWAVKTRFVELFNDISGSEVIANDYFGVYCFMEKIEADNNRLDISKLDPWENSPEERTGGYIFKRDRPDPGEPTFSVSGLSSATVHVDPDGLEITPTQKSYLVTHTNEVLPALRSSTGINPSTGLHYSDYLDVDSFIDNLWLNVLVMDPDWGRLSQFFYKDRGEKIVAGPIWDYDRTMGSRDSRDDNPRVWDGSGDASRAWYDSRYEWFGRLFGFQPIHGVANLSDPQLKTSRPDLFQDVIDRWFELRADGFSKANIEATIEMMAGEISEAQERNFARWSALSVNSIQGTNYAEAGTTNWEMQVSHLKGWLEARTEWIDQQFFSPPVFNNPGGEVAENLMLTMSSPDGDVYYTLDGSDPRAPGGAPAAGSTQGSNVTLTDTTTVIARAYDGQQWGAPTEATFVIGGFVADSSNLVISEIMYDPPGPTPDDIAAGFDDDAFFEFLEIFNTSETTVDLTEVTFTDGIDFNFADSAITTLAPGGRALVVRNTAGFLHRYGAELSDLISGEFANDTGLSGSGERLIMEGMNGVIADITYNNKYPWPKSADGDGPSLVYIAGSTDQSDALNWRPSSTFNGNPGSSDSTMFFLNPVADNDGDGFNAFAEYALGTNDNIPDNEILVGSIDDNGRFALTYPRNLSADDAQITLQVSTDLKIWTLATDTLEDGKETHNGDGTVTYTFRTPEAARESQRLYGRLLITQR